MAMLAKWQNWQPPLSAEASQPEAAESEKSFEQATAEMNTVYQGIVVGGETYHYLPAFLRHVPMPRDIEALAALERGIAATGMKEVADSGAPVV